MQTLSSAHPIFENVMRAETGAKGWHEAVMDSLELLRIKHPKLHNMPSPRSDGGVEQWANLALQYPNQWKLIISKAFWTDDSWAKQIADPEEVMIADLQTCYPCNHCDFRTWRKAALATHLRAKHGILPPQNYVVEGSVCPACGGEFGTRLRALQHLALPNQSCNRKLLEGTLQVLPDERLCEVEAETKVETKRLRSLGLDVRHTFGATVPMGTKHRGSR